MERELVLSITASSHPEFDLFATVTINSRQVSRRGDREAIDKFTNELIAAAARTGHSIRVVEV